MRRPSHDSAFLELTRSICPVCRRDVEAEVVAREGRVYLRKRCADHGAFEALVYGDAERYVEIQRYNKPGDRPLRLQTEVVDGCPWDCGICPEHKQHSCLGIIEVNTACNLDCPICFAESGTGHQPDGYSLNLERVEAMLDAFVEAEGEPEAIQLSGGEPSIHPQILDMLAAAKAHGIKLVMLNTNGIRLARDPRFAPALADIGVHVYLQFDGFRDSTHLAIRGRRLQDEKLRALDRCARAGVGVSLAAAVERGVNDDEVGDIVGFGVQHPAVTGVFFQPVTHSGRFLDFDPRVRLTNSDVIDAIARQLPHWFRHDDFVPVPCCSPTCRSATYALRGTRLLLRHALRLRGGPLAARWRVPPRRRRAHPSARPPRRRGAGLSRARRGQRARPDRSAARIRAWRGGHGRRALAAVHRRRARGGRGGRARRSGALRRGGRRGAAGPERGL
jgi:7,8-dihydro-6-hydroxymethylpterin dimethyltransferase